MSDDTDPMLGDPATQDAYKAGVLAKVQQEIDTRREARRKDYAAVPDSPPVIQGATGFGGSNSALE